MENFKRGRNEWQMLELPNGITTSEGSWYHITRDGIERYVPGLLKEFTLEKIIREADAWVKSSDGLALMLYFILVYATVNPLIAMGISLLFYFAWYFNTSVFVNVATTPVAKVLNNDGFVYTVSAIFLIGMTFNDFISDLGISIDFSAIWYGLGLFFLYKVGLLRMLLNFIRSKFGTESSISKQDRVLNMLLIRYGMKTGNLTGKVQEMEKELIRVANYHKTKKKK
jgi:hypothetical protein